MIVPTVRPSLPLRFASACVALATLAACGEDSGPSAASCRLARTASFATGIGTPKAPGRLPSTGTIRVSVLFVEFADVSADRSPDEVLPFVEPTSSEFYSAISYGTLALEITPHLRWLRLSGPASRYGQAIRTFDGHRAFIDEAVSLADADVDFSRTDLVLVISAPNASEVPYGPTWMGNDSAPIVADGHRITNGVTSGADLLNWDGLWFPHEMGHSMGLPDLYSYTEPTGYTRPFSIMDDIAGAAPEYLAWERWQLGWIADAQVACRPDIEPLLLAPIEIAGGTKLAVVPVSNRRAVVVESRRALGYDANLEREGAVVYVVDAAAPTGARPIVVANGQEALGPGESVRVEGVTVTVVDASEAGDTVRIETTDPT